MTAGCVHVHVTDGQIVKVFLHLTDLPRDGVIHLTPDTTLGTKEFLSSHPIDANEIIVSPSTSFFDLGDDSVQVR